MGRSTDGVSVNDVVIELVDASLDPLLCVCVSAAYPVKSFAGRKRIIISTTSLLGTKNPFLGIGYIVVGCVVLMLGIVFLVIHIKYGKRYSSFFLFCLFFFSFPLVLWSGRVSHFGTTTAQLVSRPLIGCAV